MRYTLFFTAFALSALAAPIAQPQDRITNKEVRGVGRPARGTRSGARSNTETGSLTSDINVELDDEVDQSLHQRGVARPAGKRDDQIDQSLHQRGVARPAGKRDVNEVSESEAPANVEDDEWEVHADDRREAIFGRRKNSRDVEVDEDENEEELNARSPSYFRAKKPGKRDPAFTHGGER